MTVIVVKIEIWPYGDEAARREIGRMQIANVGGDADMGQYEVTLSDDESGPSFKKYHLDHFPRQRGFWWLLHRALRTWLLKEWGG